MFTDEVSHMFLHACKCALYLCTAAGIVTVSIAIYNVSDAAVDVLKDPTYSKCDRI